MAGKNRLGLDLIDIAIHLTVTGLLLGFLAATTNGPDRTALMTLAAAASVGLLGLRRWWALRQGAGPSGPERVGELESRLAATEAAVDPGLGDQLEVRLAEVEERLDFTERILARQAGAGRLPEDAQR
jgi:hypothetical protein